MSAFIERSPRRVRGRADLQGAHAAHGLPDRPEHLLRRPQPGGQCLGTGPTDNDLVAHCGLPPRDARFPHMTRTAWSPNPRGQTVDAFHTTGRASLATTQTALPGARTHSENLDYIEVGADQHALSAHHSFDGR